MLLGSYEFCYFPISQKKWQYFINAETDAFFYWLVIFLLVSHHVARFISKHLSYRGFVRPTLIVNERLQRRLGTTYQLPKLIDSFSFCFWSGLAVLILLAFAAPYKPSFCVCVCVSLPLCVFVRQDEALMEVSAFFDRVGMDPRLWLTFLLGWVSIADQVC